MSAVTEARGPGELAIGDDVRDALVELRRRAAVTAAPELELDRVREVELAVGMRFEDDLLAVFAAGVPQLVDRYHMTLGKVLAHTGALQQQRARGDLVGVGQLDYGLYLCVELRRREGGATTLVVYDCEDQTRTPTSLLEWLRARIAELPVGGEPGPFVPRLVKAMPESYAKGRRVRHKVFGEGKVLTETGTGPTRKVKADFPRVGLKLLQARFLEFLD